MRACRPSTSVTRPSNQSDAILQYALRYGFDIVPTHAGNGKNGLRLDGRDGLKQLLIDVEGSAPGFKAVLVYEVSRCGRLQNADESTYCEYVCRRSGVEIRYCAEQARNRRGFHELITSIAHLGPKKPITVSRRGTGGAGAQRP